MYKKANSKFEARNMKQYQNSNYKDTYTRLVLIIGKSRLRAMCSRFHSNSKYCYSSESVKTCDGRVEDDWFQPVY